MPFDGAIPRAAKLPFAGLIRQREDKGASQAQMAPVSIGFVPFARETIFPKGHLWSQGWSQHGEPFGWFSRRSILRSTRLQHGRTKRSVLSPLQVTHGTPKGASISQKKIALKRRFTVASFCDK